MGANGPELRIKSEELDDYKVDENFLDSTMCRALLDNASFKNEKDKVAIIGCGGTISSVYSPLYETIQPTNHSPVFDLLNALHEAFGIAEDNITYLPLINKDSRDIDERDLRLTLDIINNIENERVLLTCGTYGVQLFTYILSQHVHKKNKIVVATGSMLPSPFREQDADVNGIAGVTALNTIHAMRKQPEENDPIVLCSFHGRVFKPKECIDLDLHPVSHKNIKFYRGVRFRSD